MLLVAMDGTILTCIVIMQFVYRTAIGWRLLPDADFAAFSTYSIVKQNGGVPGADCEISWGGKLLCYLLVHGSYRLCNSIQSPRVLSHLVACGSTVLVYYTSLRFGLSTQAALIAALLFALGSSHVQTGSYSNSPETLSPLFQGFFAVSAPIAHGWIIRGLVFAVLVAWVKIVFAPIFIFATYIELVESQGNLGGFAAVGLVGLAMSLLYHHKRKYKPVFTTLSHIVAYSLEGSFFQRYNLKSLFFNSRTLFRYFKGYVFKTLFLWLAVPFAFFNTPLAILLISGGICVVVQRKYWPLHMYVLYFPLAIASGHVMEKAPLFFMAAILPSAGISVYYLIRQCRLDSLALSKLIWEQVGTRHFISDYAAREAASYIGTEYGYPDTFFCYGRMAQIFVYLRALPPKPFAGFGRTALRSAFHRGQLEQWSRRHKPEYVFYPEPQDLAYYPIELLSGLFGREYHYEKSFYGGQTLLFKKKVKSDITKVRQYQSLYHAIRFEPDLANAFSPVDIFRDVTEDDLKKSVEWIREHGNKVVVWGRYGVAETVSLLRKSGVAVIAVCDERRYGHTVIDEFHSRSQFEFFRTHISGTTRNAYNATLKYILSKAESLRTKDPDFFSDRLKGAQSARDTGVIRIPLFSMRQGGYPVIGVGRCIADVAAQWKFCQANDIPFRPIWELNALRRALCSSGEHNYICGQSPLVDICRCLAAEKGVVIEHKTYGELDAIFSTGDGIQSTALFIADNTLESIAAAHEFDASCTVVDAQRLLGFSLLPGRLMEAIDHYARITGVEQALNERLVDFASISYDPQFAANRCSACLISAYLKLHDVPVDINNGKNGVGLEIAIDRSRVTLSPARV